MIGRSVGAIVTIKSCVSFRLLAVWSVFSYKSKPKRGRMLQSRLVLSSDSSRAALRPSRYKNKWSINSIRAQTNYTKMKYLKLLLLLLHYYKEKELKGTMKKCNKIKSTPFLGIKEPSIFGSIPYVNDNRVQKPVRSKTRSIMAYFNFLELSCIFFSIL